MGCKELKVRVRKDESAKHSGVAAVHTLPEEGPISRDLGISGALVAAAGECRDESHLGIVAARGSLCRVWFKPRFEHIPILSKASSGAPSPSESLTE